MGFLVTALPYIAMGAQAVATGVGVLGQVNAAERDRQNQLFQAKVAKAKAAEAAAKGSINADAARRQAEINRKNYLARRPDGASSAILANFDLDTEQMIHGITAEAQSAKAANMMDAATFRRRAGESRSLGNAKALSTAASGFGTLAKMGYGYQQQGAFKPFG